MQTKDGERVLHRKLNGGGGGTHLHLSSRGGSWMGLGPGRARRPVCAGKSGVTDHVSDDTGTD